MTGVVQMIGFDRNVDFDLADVTQADASLILWKTREEERDFEAQQNRHLHAIWLILKATQNFKSSTIGKLGSTCICHRSIHHFMYGCMYGCHDIGLDTIRYGMIISSSSTLLMHLWFVSYSQSFEPDPPPNSILSLHIWIELQCNWLSERKRLYSSKLATEREDYL